MDWIANNIQGWFNYPRTSSETKEMVKIWTDALQKNEQQAKPYISAFHLNLLGNKDAQLVPHKFGGSIGIHKLSELLKEYGRAGVNHMAIHLRRSETPISDAIHQIAEVVLPNFRLS